MHALAPSTHRAPSTESIVALHHLHPLTKVDLPLFVNDFHLETNLVLDSKTFIFPLTRSPHPSNMVYELLQDTLSLMTLLMVFFLKNM